MKTNNRKTMKVANTGKKKVVKLTESDLARVVKRVINEQIDDHFNIDYYDLQEHIVQLILHELEEMGYDSEEINENDEMFNKLEDLAGEIAENLVEAFNEQLSYIVDEYRDGILAIVDED